jgi:ATP-binding cassette, subfamily B, bacterial
MTMSDASSEQRQSGLAIIARGLRLSPQITEGLWLTVVLVLVSTVGGTVVPLLVRQVIDTSLSGPINSTQVAKMLLIALGVLVIAAMASYWSMRRIFVASERGLAHLRVTAFEHVHDLSMLTQNAQRRGGLVSRVSSDIDQVSQFLQSSGIFMISSVAQMAVALLAMSIMSWQLTLLMVVCFVPLWLSLRLLALKMSRAYDAVRASVADMLSVIAEPIVGAAEVRSYAIEDRTQHRIDKALDHNYRLNVRAQALTAGTFASAALVGGIATAAVVAVGTWLGVSGSFTAGTIVAFVFLVGLFTSPAQMATQVISDAQNAIASWRRVIDVLETPADIVDPGPSASARLEESALTVAFSHVSFGYPTGPVVLSDLNLHIPARQRVAVVGETGSGKSTFAKLVTRLVDPVEGAVLLGGLDLRDLAFSDVRKHVLTVPQEGFLFDATLRDNLRYGKLDASDEQMLQAVAHLELDDWVAGLPAGLDTPVGQRGESLSVGERQLVALIRTALADPSLLVLDEATSAVDPRTELRTTTALSKLLLGRTSITIAHRLSTAEQADRILVFDAGRIVEDGTHAELVTGRGVYSRLYASWVRGTSGRIDV